MRICFVHDVIGDLGGAEANVRHVASGLSERGHQVSFLHGEATGSGEERFLDLFAKRFDWAESGAGAVEAAIADNPDVIYVHKLSNLTVLRKLVAVYH